MAKLDISKYLEESKKEPLILIQIRMKESLVKQLNKIAPKNMTPGIKIKTLITKMLGEG